MKQNRTEHTAENEAQKERGFGVDAVVVDAILAVVALGAKDRLNELIKDLHAADIADLLEQIRPDERLAFIQTLGGELDPEVLSELDEGVRDEVLGAVAPEKIAAAVSELDTDDAVYLVEDLAPETQAEVLASLDAVARRAIERSLTYPEYSAGRLMQRRFVWAPKFMSVGQLIDLMRADDDLPQQFYDVIIVDPAFRPVGTVPLSRVMANPRDVLLEGLMVKDITIFKVDQAQEDVGYAFNQYHLVSAPVVDETGRLVGVIAIDDAMAVLDEEAEEDLLRLGGVGDESLADAVARVAWRRFPWLAVNLLTAVLASLVIGLFDAAIQQVVALAVLMPIVASMGGNAGTQTLTVAVRALATKDLTRRNAFRIIARETLVGLFNGFAFAGIVGAIGYVWFGDVTLGAVLAIAMVINMLVAGLAGILIPMGLDRVGADPALASGVFVTTVTDVVGFFAFLGVAALLLL